MNIFQQVLILSAELNTRTKEENDRVTSNLETSLNECNISFNKAIGYYKGSEETSFVCLPKNEQEVEVLKDFAFKSFKQESVLFQDSNGQSYLIFENDEEETIGKLRQVNSKLIEQLESYTIMNGAIYTTERI